MTAVYPRLMPHLFEAINERFGGFTVDAAADDRNHLLERYWTPKEDGLAQSWAGERVWCHPPYENITPWVEKANLREADLAVLLLPVRPEWWMTKLHCDDTLCQSVVLESMIRKGQRWAPPGAHFLAIWRHRNPRVPRYPKGMD